MTDSNERSEAVGAEAFAKAERKARVSHKGAVTGRISETSRLVGFGIVAWVFAIHTSETPFSTTYIAQYEAWVNFAGLVGMLAIIFDYFQYLCAYFSVQNALGRKSANYQFNKKHFGYVLQEIFFWAKQICAAAGALVVATTFAFSVVLE
ncbi:hypothetical protein [Dinoroseobacter sp. S76]|uniref:hypothetical protein n=1 Tax=Dinoroseobacter sp. S76 TaxID=3415124 RepID=UPI003C7B57F2